MGLNPTIVAPRRYCSHDRESASIEEGAQVGSFHLQAQAQARRPEAALYMAPANLLNVPVCLRVGINFTSLRHIKGP